MGHIVIFNSEESILKSEYNYGFEIFKIYNICLKNTIIKF